MVINDHIPLPSRRIPREEVRIFDDEGELQIYNAIKVHKLKVAEVAFRCDTTHATVYAILKRVQARLDGNQEPGAPAW